MALRMTPRGSRAAGEVRRGNGRVVGAGDALVFASVEGENGAGGRGGSSRGRREKLRWGCVVLGDRDTFQATAAPPCLPGFFRPLRECRGSGPFVRGTP